MRSTPQAARREWNQAIPGLVIVGVFAALIYCHWQRGQHLVGQPLAITPVELRAVESPDSLPTPLVTLPVERHLDTGVRLTRRAYAIQNVECDYVVIPVADKWMIAEVPAGFEGSELTGLVAPWTNGAHSEALEMVRDKIDPESLVKLLPYQLEAGYDLQSESRLMLSIGLGMIAFGLLWAALGTRKRSAPHAAYADHPQYAPAGGWPGRRLPAR